MLPWPGRRLEGKLIAALLEDLEHRGPDDSGVLALREQNVSLHREPQDDIIADAVLVHRRLSIIDLSDSGWQPMGTADGRYYIIFNGEIYNYLELRVQLRALGHQFRSSSDTEVLLAAYAQWGPEALSRLIGMFAFAILDVESRRLFLARDFFGIKPLYYANGPEGFVFASDINALLHASGVRRTVNAPRLYEYLRFGITDYGGETLFSSIKQLPAAHYMEISLDGCRITGPTRYWKVDLDDRIELSFEEAAKRLRDLFLENVSLHLRSDVAVGAALSGGIDSSSIVAVMRHLDADLTIHAFSYIADDPAVSEERWVDIAAAAVDLHVHKVQPRPEDLAADLEELVALQGECFGGTSIYAQRRIFQKANDVGIKVMLDGQGADEIFGGYENYIGARLISLIRHGRLAEAARFLRNKPISPGSARSRMWLRALALLLPSSLQDPLRRGINEDLMPRWLNSAWFEDRGVRSKTPDLNKQRKDVLRQSLHQTLTETSLPALLRYEDRNSMASSIESRVPFLTPALVKFVLALPEEYLIAADGTTKAVFRRAMRGIVPDRILDRTDKIGFATPEKRWLLTLRPWAERILGSEIARSITALNATEVQREWRGILAGEKRFDFRAWRWINTILWVEKFAVDAK
jgi:asparagine synthase (glutamine-hydrolysing)